MNRLKYLLPFLFITLYSLVPSSDLLANSPEEIRHKVVKDKVVKKGHIIVKSQVSADGKFYQVSTNYKMKLRAPYFLKLEGDKNMTLPASYFTLEGILELEESGVYSDDRIKITHLGREDFRGFYDCHKLKLEPVKKKKWDAIVYYHPDVPSVGWAKVIINFKDIPIIQQHKVQSYYLE